MGMFERRKATEAECSLSSPLTTGDQTAVNVPHVLQKEKWDCGLACVRMILCSMAAKNSDLSMLESMCPTKSIWTIDLAYLLRQFDVSLAFFTVTLGANPDYATESFYMDHMLEDQHRVNKLFEGAELHDIPIYHGSLPVENLMRICHSGLYTVITLVEKGTLWKSITTESSWQDSLWGVTRGFIGHYVVICGCNLVRNEFLIKDPAISNPNGVWISADDFDAARRSFGTDEDMLIVSMHEIRSISGSGMDLSALISDSS